MEFERTRIAFWAERDFRNLGRPPKGELSSLRLDHRPHGTPFADHAEPEEIAVEGEGLLHVIHREEDVTDVLDDSHGTRNGLPEIYEIGTNRGFDSRPKEPKWARGSIASFSCLPATSRPRSPSSRRPRNSSNRSGGPGRKSRGSRASSTAPWIGIVSGSIVSSARARSTTGAR